MKMSNADIVLNAAERVVKCKLAYICHGYYITAPVFAAVRGGSGFFYILFCRTWPFYRDVVREWCVRGRPDGSERGFDVDKQLFVGFSPPCTAPAARAGEPRSGGAAQQHLLYPG